MSYWLRLHPRGPRLWPHQRKRRRRPCWRLGGSRCARLQKPTWGVKIQEMSPGVFFIYLLYVCVYFLYGRLQDHVQQHSRENKNETKRGLHWNLSLGKSSHFREQAGTVCFFTPPACVNFIHVASCHRQRARARKGSMLPLYTLFVWLMVSGSLACPRVYC